MNFAGYPAVRFYTLGMTEVLKDQKNQWRTYKFVIEVIYKLTNENRATAEATMEDAMEAVMNAIDSSYTLGGFADNAVLSVGTAMEAEYPWGPALVMKLTLNAYVVQFFA